jgi:hypothetical protein
VSTVSTTDPAFLSMLHKCVDTLQRISAYELPPSLDRRLRTLGESEEFLNQAEHEELLALVDFARQRTLEKLEARAALEKVCALMPDVCDTP